MVHTSQKFCSSTVWLLDVWRWDDRERYPSPFRLANSIGYSGFTKYFCQVVWKTPCVWSAIWEGRLMPTMRPCSTYITSSALCSSFCKLSLLWYRIPLPPLFHSWLSCSGTLIPRWSLKIPRRWEGHLGFSCCRHWSHWLHAWVPPNTVDSTRNPFRSTRLYIKTPLEQSLVEKTTNFN